MYYLSKIAWFFATPSNLLPSLVLLGLVMMVTRLRRFGIALSWGSVIAIMILGLSPIANYIIFPLEERFPVFQDDGTPVDGIIFLGGAIEAADTAARGQIVANESSERVMETASLAFRYPDAKILISGGGGNIFGYTVAEAPLVADYLKSLRIDPARMIIEDRSRTTYENAVFSRDLAKPEPGQRWLLVTSAWHMPRAIGVFEKAGFVVTPYPVDFRTSADENLNKPFAFVSDGLRRTDVATKEWAGLVAYWLAGRTSALFPAPRLIEHKG